MVRPTFAGIGARHGFDGVLRTNKNGRQSVCVYAINIGTGKNALLGCRTVTVRVSKDVAGSPLLGKGDSVGGYRPSDQTWHLTNSLSGSPSDYAFQRGTEGMIPVVGDWDGS